ELANAPGNAATAHVVFRNSRNSLLVIIVVVLLDHRLEIVEERASLICLINWLAILDGTVPNSELTCPLVTGLPVRASTTTYGNLVVSTNRSTCMIKSAAARSLVTLIPISTNSGFFMSCRAR